MLETMVTAVDGAKGLKSDWLYEYGATCETYRSQRVVLEMFIKDERK